MGHTQGFEKNPCRRRRRGDFQAAHALNWNLAEPLPPPWRSFPKRAVAAAAVAFKAVHPLFINPSPQPRPPPLCMVTKLFTKRFNRSVSGAAPPLSAGDSV